MTDWYEYPTNYSNGTSVDGPGKLFMSYPNFILNDMFGAGITLLIFLVTFGLSAASGTKKALAVSSFIAFLFSLTFVKLSMLNLSITIVLIILMIVGSLGSSSESM